MTSMSYVLLGCIQRCRLALHDVLITNTQQVSYSQGMREAPPWLHFELHNSEQDASGRISI